MFCLITIINSLKSSQWGIYAGFSPCHWLEWKLWYKRPFHFGNRPPNSVNCIIPGKLSSTFIRFAVADNYFRDIGIYIYNCRDCSHLFLGNWYLHLWLSGLQSIIPGKLASTFAIVGLVVNFPLKLWSSFAAEALMGFEFFWCYEKMSCTGLWFWNLSRLPGILLWKNFGNADLLQKQILCQLILLRQTLTPKCLSVNYTILLSSYPQIKSWPHWNQ